MSRSQCSSLADHKSSAGFTRLDLLAIIVLFCFMVALLMSAFDGGMHPAARRNQCMNNLKQLALAALDHKAQKRFLPTGGWGKDWIGDPDAGLGENQPGGWAYSVMFFMDGQAQIMQISGQPWARKVALGAMIEGAGRNASDNLRAVQAQFYCPGRRAPGLYPGGAPAVNSRPLFPPNLVAKTDYAANGGTVGFLYDERRGACGPNDLSTAHAIEASEVAAVGPLPAIDHTWYLPPYAPPATADTTARQPSAAPEGTTFTGVCWYRSQVSLKMPDGTSHVYLFGEKYMDKRSYASGGEGSGDEESVYRGMAASNIRLAASGGIYTSNVAPAESIDGGPAPIDRYGAFLYPPMQDGSVGPGADSARPAGVRVDWFNAIRFGSAHSDAFNMAFCDGSVHWISYDIDPRLHAMLSDRQDGQAADPAAVIDKW